MVTASCETATLSTITIRYENGILVEVLPADVVTAVVAASVAAPFTKGFDVIRDVENL